MFKELFEEKKYQIKVSNEEVNTFEEWLEFYESGRIADIYLWPTNGVLPEFKFPKFVKATDVTTLDKDGNKKYGLMLLFSGISSASVKTREQAKKRAKRFFEVVK